MIPQDSIVALATAPGTGAIAVIRISGPDAITIINQVFKPVKKSDIEQALSHSIHLGHLFDDHKLIDQVLVSIFRTPHSYTGENVVEISCHGSIFIQQQVMQLLLKNGCRTARAGEFTMRAFLNGKMDLSQAEAVADLIAAENESAHKIAINQMRGGFSNELAHLRDKLLQFASLLELELDFSEEDVEFANREQFNGLLSHIAVVLKKLIDSFSVGNAIKNGIPIVIAGAPNVGKSTLLNALLNEERAIVSDIAGTTRDTVEDTITISGMSFRFIDTAGIRKTNDVVEQIGIQRTFNKMEQCDMILYMVDVAHCNVNLSSFITEIKEQLHTLLQRFPDKKIIVIGNKADTIADEVVHELKLAVSNLMLISAKNKKGINELITQLLELVHAGDVAQHDVVVTNARHYDALNLALHEIIKVREGLQNQLTADLLAIELRQALYHLGEITGQISNDELLGNIFSKFCIGK